MDSAIRIIRGLIYPPLAAAFTLCAASENLIENGSFEEEKCPFTWRPRESITVRCKPENTPGRFISRADTTRVHSGKRSWYHECRVAPGENNMRFRNLKCGYGKMYEPIQFGIQQDSDEFLSILCDNLEKEAKQYNKENFLENSFKGKISNEILSLEKEYPYYSHGEEPFFRITLDIKGHKSLEEALDAY
ncbi:MAG: hypothetical protein IKO93_08995, partial [Lentisphaeria bacterium]|nr:hypothetical protein [Lentisphaeria bacterium]